VPVGFLYHFDDEESRNHDLPVTGEVLLQSGSDFSPITDQPAQHMKIVPELEAQSDDWVKTNNAFSVMTVTQQSSGIYERLGIGLIVKNSLTKAIGPPE
jgi:hypothetical protein